MKIRLHATVLSMALALSACGAKIVKDAPPPPVDQVLAEAASPHLQAQLAWVLVSEGPGAWAEEAVWDEYLVRVRNTSTAPVDIAAVMLEDSLGHGVGTLDSRGDLIRASKQTARRYKAQGLAVHAGMGGAGMGALGVATTAAGVAYAGTLSLGLWGGVASSSAALSAAAGLLVGGPVIGTVGIVRAVRARKMDNRIQARRTPLPVTLAPGEERVLDLFFPITPAPGKVSIVYRQAGAEHHAEIDTRQALAGLHLPAPAANAVAPAPSAAVTEGQASEQ